MAVLPLISAILLLAHGTSSLQVSPNSPCATACLDASQAISDPNASNTVGSEIVCLDQSYNDTAVGKTFQSCVTCLQTSTSSDGSGESDQKWFLYNIRYALASCIFGFSNVTDAVSTPCSTDASCGPLQPSIEDGDFITTNETEFSYCSANSGSAEGSYNFLGQSLNPCISCLQDSGQETYLSNFMIALQAGCVQQPPAGTLIGLDGTVFSTTPVNITFPGDNYLTQSQSGHKGLSQGAIIGIAVGLGTLLMITVAVLFVCSRKRIALKKMKSLHSPLDSRFGATNITSPNSGAYGNPYTNLSVNEAPAPFDISHLSAKELKAMRVRGSISKSQISEPISNRNTWETINDTYPTSEPPSYTPVVVPTHQAYIPTSPVEHQVENAFHLKRIPPSKTSPGYSSSASTSLQSSPSYPPLPPSRGPTSSMQSPPSRYSPKSSPGAQSQSMTTPPSRISPRNPPPINTHQSNSSRSLSRQGIGGATLASAVENNQTMNIPIKISGPMVRHDGRFDFELAERERIEREAREGKDGDLTKKKVEESPESAVSQEQWPGSY